MDAQEHIQKIRREKFGLDIDGSVPKNPLARDVHRATEQLSEGLYSKNIHFILELIQNAEDNSYPPNVVPELTFILTNQNPVQSNDSSSTLIVINNEIGFKENHVEALCAVGTSTKTNHNRAGYIGEKGIGFKSVFQVSCTPHIFSSGYRFYFSEKPDPKINLGYIVPYWYKELPEVLKNFSKSTCIILPLKNDKQTLVKEQLFSIAPETILFLSKLEGLTIKSDAQNVLSITRESKQKPLVRLKVDSVQTSFWVIDETFDVPEEINEEKRTAIATRTVTIALPLTQDYKPKHNVFAFLPTEMNSGLPFLINADFLLSAGRESIQIDKPWNKWLRDCVAPTFEKAFFSLLENNGYRFTPYKYLPREDIQNSFFQESAKEIKRLLGDKKIIWTYRETLELPSNVRIASKRIRNLFLMDDVPQQILDVPIIHTDIARYEKELKWIGVTNISHEEILACLNDKQWIINREIEWFVSLFGYLESQNWATNQILADVAILPIQGEPRKLNSNQQTTYFPTEDAQLILQLIHKLEIGLAIDFLDGLLYEQIRDNTDIINWLQDALSVQIPTIENLCIDLINLLHTEKKTILPLDLIRITAFIRDQLDNVENEQKVIDTIKNKLPLLLDDGNVDCFPGRGSEVLMPKTMDPETGWQIVFDDDLLPNNDYVLSDSYLNNSSQEEKENWRSFFLRIGATECPTPQRTTQVFYEQWQEREFSEYEETYLRRNHERSTRKAKLSHYVPPDWLWNGWDISIRKAKALVNWLEKCFQLKQTNWLRGQYEYFFRYDRSKYFESEFSYYIKIIPWFPSTQGFKRPGDIFLDKPELREVFGDKLPYAKIEPSPEVVGFLKIRTDATINEMLHYLRDLAKHPAAEVDKDLIAKIYSFFANRTDLFQTLLHRAFRDEALLLVSEPEPKWIRSDETLYPDFSAVFGNAYYYLEGEYSEKLEDFFIETLGIPNTLDTQLYANALVQIAKQLNRAPESIKVALEQIYPKLLDIARLTEKPDWWAEFCYQVPVWTQRNEFVYVANTDVYIPDDQELKRKFSPGVHFVWRPEKASFNDYLPLYNAFGVKSLVANIHLNAEVTELHKQKIYNQLLTTERVRAICIYLYNKENIRYLALKEDGTLAQLVGTREIVVSSLVVHYRLDDITNVDDKSQVFWDKKSSRLYRIISDTDDLLVVKYPTLLARQLTGGQRYEGLENWIARVLNATPKQLENIFKSHNWTYPKDEAEWFENIANLDKSVDDVETGNDIQESNENTSLLFPINTDPDIEDQDSSVPSPSRVKPEKSRTPNGASIMAVTHVIPQSTSGSPRIDQPNRSEIGQAGVDLVIAYEKARGREAQDMNDIHTNNPGYDVKSTDPNSGEIRFIEVKTSSGLWDSRNPARLTPAQFNEARKRGNQFWLYVVESVNVDPKIYPIRNPANRIDRYLFDHGWQNIAETEEPITQPSEQ